MVKTIIAGAAVVTCLVLLGPAVAVAQQTDPWIGTWKLNVEKSKADPGPLPRSVTLRIEPAPDGAQKHTTDSLNAQGQATHTERVAKYDGVDVPVVSQPPTPVKVTNSFRRLDERSFEITSKRHGKAVTTSRMVISPDGKTLTQRVTGTDPQGRTINSAFVLDKQ
jgi:hypothetical protein